MAGRPVGSKSKFSMKKLRNLLTDEQKEAFWLRMFHCANGYVSVDHETGEKKVYAPDMKAASIIADRLEAKLSAIELSGEINIDADLLLRADDELKKRLESYE